MTEMVQFSALAPVLPEIVLAIGALVLLMIGAIGGQKYVARRSRCCRLS